MEIQDQRAPQSEPHGAPAGREQHELEDYVAGNAAQAMEGIDRRPSSTRAARKRTG